jgi:hypothetical protein
MEWSPGLKRTEQLDVPKYTARYLTQTFGAAEEARHRQVARGESAIECWYSSECAS